MVHFLFSRNGCALLTAFLCFAILFTYDWASLRGDPTSGIEIRIGRNVTALRSRQEDGKVHVEVNANVEGKEDVGVEEKISVEEKTNVEEKVQSIAFLFLSSTHMDEDMWSRWFPPPQDDGRYTIFVHSKDQDEIPLGPFFCPYAIPAVATTWGDLHDAMMQLLQHAYFKDGNATAFVFVGDTSIPIVSFDEFYQSITRDGDRSRVCWGRPKNDPCTTEFFRGVKGLRDVHNRTLGAKAELWSTLSRRHVRQLIVDRPLMDSWKSVVRARSERNWVGDCGATDEIFIPTLLFFRFDPTEFFTTDSREVKCPHMVFWDNATGILCDTVLDTCDSHRKPYTSTHYVKERGLEVLRDAGFMMLRKVFPGAAMKTKNERLVKLSDGLSLFHQRRSTESLPPVSSNSSSIMERSYFVCKRPDSFAR